MRAMATITGLVAITAIGCVHVKTDPIKIEPVRIDIYHHVDRELDDFFKFQDQASPSGSATQPAPTGAP